jgi:hypothetical protein
MPEEILAFLWAETGSNATDPSQESWNRAFGGLPQVRLEFAEGRLDRVEVWRI